MPKLFVRTTLSDFDETKLLQCRVTTVPDARRPGTPPAPLGDGG